MLRRFTQKEKEAVKGYYVHRRNRFLSKTKAQCLEVVNQAVRNSRKLSTFSACAGTFWFGWKDGVTTIHSEDYWWRMKKVSTWLKEQARRHGLAGR